MTSRTITVIPPSDREVELCLLGTVVLNPAAFGEVSWITPEDFSTPQHSALWKAILDAITGGTSADPVTLTRMLARHPDDYPGWQRFFEFLAASPVAATNGPSYAARLRDLSQRRRLVEVAAKMLEQASNQITDDPAAMVADEALSEISRACSAKDDLEDAGDVAARVVAELNRPLENFPTQMPRLDAVMGGGFYKHKFYAITARMKQGKTAMMGTIAYNLVFPEEMGGAVEERARVLFLSLEMGSDQIMQRLMARRIGVNSLDYLDPKKRETPKLRNGSIQCQRDFSQRGLYFRNKPRMTLDDLRATLARVGLSGKIDGIIVDGIQLISGRSRNQSGAEHLDDVAQSLAEAAVRYPIFVIGVAQLNREGEVRGGDGLLNACDLTFAMHKIESTISQDQAWLQMLASRYTQFANVGSKEAPAFELEVRSGPYFRELPA